MVTFFRPIALSEDQAAQTLPLVQVTWPEVDLARWQQFVRSFARRSANAPSGILALRDAGDYFCAMFAYRVDLDLRRGRVLTVQLFTAVDLTNSPKVAQALLGVAEAKALGLGCAEIEIRLHKEQSTLAAQLRSLGLADATDVFSKTVDRAPSPH
jgi:hypothetical protein